MEAFSTAFETLSSNFSGIFKNDEGFSAGLKAFFEGFTTIFADLKSALSSEK